MDKLTDAEVLSMLNGKSSAKLQKALKHIIRNKLVQFGDNVVELHAKKVNNPGQSSRTSYLDYHYLALAIDVLDRKDAIPQLFKHSISGGKDGITAGMSYIRLGRRDTNDFSFFREIGDMDETQGESMYSPDIRNYSCLKFARYAVICNDRIIPTYEDQKYFISEAWKDMEDHESIGKVIGNFRVYASCCAGFDKDLVKEFLYKVYEIQTIENGSTKYVTDALAGEYITYDVIA